MLQWADDESQKCLIASDTKIRVSAYYSDSIVDALVELMVVCATGLNLDNDLPST
jgi:hypothetical protein